MLRGGGLVQRFVDAQYTRSPTDDATTCFLRAGRLVACARPRGHPLTPNVTVSL